MSILVPFNGSTYIIPTPNEIGWGTNLDNYLVAIANGCLQNIGGNFTLSNDVDFGGTNGIKSVYYKTRSTSIAGSGQFRLANAVDSISWRNFLDNADLPLTVNASDQLSFNGVPLAGAGVLTPNRAVVSDGSGNVTSSSVTTTELGYLSGVTSAIQTQLNSKLNLSGGTLTNDLTFSSNKGIFFTDNTSNTVKITTPTAVTTYTLKWPIAQGASNQYLTNDGSGNLSWTNAAGTGTVNTGTANQLAYYATSTNIVSGLTLITGHRALASNVNGLPVASTTTDTELGFVSGVTSSIQTQLNLLAPIANPTFTGGVVINAVSGASEQLALNGTTGFSSDTVRIRNKNTNSGVASNASIIAEVESGSLDSDAYFSSVANANAGPNIKWSWGLDGSDSGAWVLTAATTLNGTNVIRIDPTTKDIQFSNDVYSTPWTDYSGTSTITGWSSFTTKQLRYKTIGKLVFIAYRLDGASNSVNTTFTLPFAVDTGVTPETNVGRAVDNGTRVDTAVAQSVTSTTTFFKDSSGTTWSNTGTKTVWGQFWYQST